MDRRTFFKRAGAVASGAAVSTLAAPAIAQESPELKWRLTSSFPKSLDTIFGAADTFSKAIAEATDGKFQIQVFASNEIVPGLQAADAVTNGTVEMCHTASYYFWGKDPTFAFGTAVPFGLNSRMQNAWQYEGGAIALLNDFYKKYNAKGLLAGNTGCQMGGWYRKEIKTTDDIKGLKMRIGGWAGKVLARLGGVPQQIAGGDIYPALEKGTLDACEWVGPYDDEKLGFYKVAPHYYAPGWWEGGSMLLAFVNLDKWNSLPKPYQAVLAQAGHYANTWCMAKYDHLNPQALRRLLAGGTKLHVFSPQIMDAAYKATMELHAEVAKENATFKKLNDSLMSFTKDSYQWWQVAEFSYDAFMIRAMRA